MGHHRVAQANVVEPEGRGSAEEVMADADVGVAIDIDAAGCGERGARAAAEAERGGEAERDREDRRAPGVDSPAGDRRGERGRLAGAGTALGEHLGPPSWIDWAEAKGVDAELRVADSA